MKICLLTRRFDLSSGGIGRVSIEIMNRLLRTGHEVHSISLDKEDLVSYFKYAFWDIRSKIPKGCDIYHAITPMETIWIQKNRAVATILDIIPITHPDKHGARMGDNKVKYTIGKHCFNLGCRKAAMCAKVACISGHVRDEFAKHFSRTPEVIRLGIRNDLEPTPKKDDVLRIGYLGQVDRRKRVDMLVVAFTSSRLDAELWIAGKGSDEDRLREITKYDKRVHFMGFIPDDALSWFYNHIDVFCFPSAIEGYGLPIVEAMACRKPVVVMRDAIIPEDIKSRCIVVGSLVPLFSSNDILINFCNTNPDYDGNYQFAKSHSWDDCVGNYLKLYEEILG